MTSLLPEERLSRILSLLGERGALRAAALTAELGVSPATIRRDLRLLAERGQVVKVHGGAALPPSTPPNQDQFYRDRAHLNQGGKARLAEVALSLIAPHQTIYLDAGTTALALARALRRQPQLTSTLRVVTHGIDVAYALNGECALYVVGGEVYGSTYSLTGPDAVASASRYSYDTFFVGCTSLDPRGEVTNSNGIEAELKSAVMRRARRTALLADRSKWGHAGFATFARFSDLDTWVTDEVTPEVRRAFEAAGVRVLSAE